MSRGASQTFARRTAITAAGASALAAALPSRAQAQPAGEPWAVVSARGDGDFTNLEVAVAAAPANSTLLVRSGLYEITAGRMQPATGVRIIGEGAGTVVRARARLNRELFVLTASRIILEHLFLDGNASQQTSRRGTGVRVSADDIRIEDCTVLNTAGDGIWVDTRVSECVVRGNLVAAVGSPGRSSGISLMEATDCIVIGNTISGVGYAGIRVWSAAGACNRQAIIANTVLDAGVAGILVEGAVRDSTVTGNTCLDGGRDGIRVSSAGAAGRPRSLSVTGNTCVGNASDGIRVTSVVGVVISGNIVRANDRYGVRLVAAQSSAVVSNVVEDSGLHGIVLERARGTTCRGNVVIANGRLAPADVPAAGIFVTGAGSANGVSIIADNRCRDDPAAPAQRHGISVQASAGPTVVSHNALVGNGEAGLAVQAGGSTLGVPHRRLRVAVGTTELGAPHGLPHYPRSTTLALRSAGQVWLSKPADATNVYLRADGADRVVDLLIG